MSNVHVLAFPGQGQQEKIPEVAQFIDGHSVSLETIDHADEILARRVGQPLVKAALDGNANFSDAVTIQASIYTIEVAMYRALSARGIEPKMVVGHSLGEYAAMAAANVVSFEDGLELVVLRAQAMVEADKETPGGGGMVAVNGLDEEKIIDISKEEDFEIANINSPSQIVISGIRKNIDTAAAKINHMSGVSARLLNIPYAAHSSWMSGAADKLREITSDIHFKKPKIPMLSNQVVSLRLPEQFMQHLPDQLTQGVRWHPQMIEAIHGRGMKIFAEIGHGKTLTKLLKRNFEGQVKIMPIEELF